MGWRQAFRHHKQRLGVVARDWAFYHHWLCGDHSWIWVRNRNETLEPAPEGLGVKCPWRWTSTLHAPSLFPSLGRRLLTKALTSFPIEMAEQRPRVSVSGQPLVSFIVGHRGSDRLPALNLMLQTIAAQVDIPVECIVVEQSSSPESETYLPEWIRYRHCPSQPPEAPYNRSLAFNAGAEIARSDLLVLHDSDLLVPKNYAWELWRVWRAGYETINLKRFIFYLSESDTARSIGAGLLPSSPVPEIVLQNATGGGSLAVDRQAYEEIGGHDEEFVGWGGEDVDFWDRAITRRLYPYGFLPFVHLWHPAQPGKTPAKDSEAMKRLERVSAIPVDTRIARLRSRWTTSSFSKVVETDQA